MDERASILQELQPPFRVHRPKVLTAPFVFCSPHSGRRYPTALHNISRLDAHSLRKSEDCFIDELFDFVPQFGAPLIAAEFPRAYLDVNREPFELDPELFDEPLPPYANTTSARVAGGLGTIARFVADGETIYRKPPTLSDAFSRIELLYRPFHQAVRDLITEARGTFGFAILVDCHSMPSASMAHYLIGKPDLVIGDRFGLSCHTTITRITRETLTGLGYRTLLNRPYAGGYITEHYGLPSHDQHTFQLEINRALYLDERSLERSRGFDRLKRDLRVLVQRLVHDLPGEIAPSQAAE